MPVSFLCKKGAELLNSSFCLPPYIQINLGTFIQNTICQIGSCKNYRKNTGCKPGSTYLLCIITKEFIYFSVFMQYCCQLVCCIKYNTDNNTCNKQYCKITARMSALIMLPDLLPVSNLCHQE